MYGMINKFQLGDMQAFYFTDSERKNVELLLLPEGIPYKEKIFDKEHDHKDSLVQIKLAGDIYTGCYSPGVSLRADTGDFPFEYESQEVTDDKDQTEIVTYLYDKRGYRASHHLIYKKGQSVLKSFSDITNGSSDEITIEMISSFSLGKISPLMDGDGHETLKLHRIRSVWSMEGRKETIPFEDLQLEPSWGGHAVRCERFGSVGSYAVNRFFPVMAVEDSKNHIFWGASIAHNASWQMEVYRRGIEAQISGGLADREFGHWMKVLKPDETFKTPEAFITVCNDEEGEEVYRRLSSALCDAVNEGPVSEQSLPVLFNEYCTTWGNPSHENICDIVNAIQGKGFEYFVIDAGWYKTPDAAWDLSMGDYEASKELFPEGLRKTADVIRDAGMIPGLWFEIDNVGSASRAYQDEEHLLKRDGKVFTTTSRRFWDLRQDYVQEYLADKVIGTLKECGFGYIKIDCNDTIGIGCDGAESLGEGLRQNQEASLGFLNRIKEEIPGIVVENCASGGHRIEPLMMSKCAMASFSDAHECEEIPIIAANLHRVMLPAQSQIWAVIRKEDSLQRIAYSIVNTFLGRMCLSGDVWLLDDEQWALIDKGIAFYKRIAPVIKDGRTYFYGPEIKSYRHPEGMQVIFRESVKGDKAYIVMHSFNNASGKEVNIPVPSGYEIKDVYSYTDEKTEIKEGCFKYRFGEDMHAWGLYLEKA